MTLPQKLSDLISFVKAQSSDEAIAKILETGRREIYQYAKGVDFTQQQEVPYLFGNKGTLEPNLSQGELFVQRAEMFLYRFYGTRNEKGA